MARLEQTELAKRAGVSVDTIKRLERTVGPLSANVTTVEAIQRVLEAAGVEFTNGGQPGVKLRRLLKKPTMTAEHFKLLIERVKDRLHNLTVRGGFKRTPTLELHPSGATLKLDDRVVGTLTFKYAKELYRTADQYDVDEVEAWITSIARRGEGRE
jgi:transcriptional regulator with XRE-family HTH domain